MATKYSDYNYQQDIENVLNAKIGWNNATTDEERNKQSKIATAARERLKTYGYGYIADQISASGADATATRKILEQYSQPKTTTYPVETNNLKSNEVNRENAGSFEKHNEAYNYIMNTDPFKTSEAKAILSKYDLAGLQGRDNAVASGGASNGGNIDSYAASNALRQQASLVNQGQMVVLDAHQQKIDNVRGLLSDMGVNIDRVFTQDETAKNNDVARKSEIASVTGYVPNEWTYDNNIYLNKDGTVKDEFMTDEFDGTGGFTTIINNAKAKLATTTDATERANLQATINAATQAKALKTFSSPKYSKYAHEVQGVTPTITEQRRTTDLENDTVLKTLGIESADTRYGIDAEKEIAKANNQNAIDQIKAQTEGEKELLEIQNSMKGGSNKISDEAVPLIKTLMNKVNNKIATHKNGLGVTDAMKYDGDGVFSFTPPQYKPSAWKYEICNAIIDSGVPETEIGVLLNQLDLKYEDFLEVFEKRNDK